MVDTPGRDIVLEYVRCRLEREFETRGVAAHVAQQTGLSPPTLSRFVHQIQPIGYKSLDALATYWGMSFSELEAEALGQAPPVRVRETHPHLRATVMWLSDRYPEAYLRDYELRARRRYDDRSRDDWNNDIRARFFEWDQARIKQEAGEERMGTTQHVGAPKASRSTAGRVISDVVRVEREPPKPRHPATQSRTQSRTHRTEKSGWLQRVLPGSAAGDKRRK